MKINRKIKTSTHNDEDADQLRYGDKSNGEIDG